MRFRTAATTAAAIAAAGVLVLTGCTDSSAPTEEPTDAPTSEKVPYEEGTTMADLAEAGTITIGTKFAQPLFGLAGPDGIPVGFDIEIGKIIAGQLDIAPEDITWVETVSANREPFIQSGDVDIVIATYTINDKRKERISFAGPYYVAGQQLMVRSEDTAITGPDALKANPAAKVCSVTGSTPAETIKTYLASPSQLVLFDVYDKCADALRTKQVDVVTTDNVILLGFVDESKGAFKLAGEQFTEEPYGIGVKKGDTQFCEFVNGVLAKAGSSGAYEKAWTSTAGEVEGAQTPTLPTAAPCA